MTTIENEIWVETRNVYGVEKVYPHCSMAKAFAGIAGTVTLTDDTLRRIHGMGFTIRESIKIRTFA